MKNLLLAIFAFVTLTISVFAGDSAAEKAFVEKFKTAFESNDKATLESFLYKQGADPMALEFYKMMITDGAGSKISKIELVDLSPEEIKKAEGTQEGPGGQKMKMPVKPTKKLQITVDTKSDSGSSSSTSSPMVAEKDGKFVVPVPGSAK
ncbi:MAG: hypothetical protein ACJ8KX_06665 [Chthoniobacterales bacterium]